MDEFIQPEDHVKPERKHRKLTEEKRAAIPVLYSGGMPASKIAIQLGVSESCVFAYMRHIGMPSRPGFLAMRKCTLNEDVFSRAEDSEEASYWVGMLMSDGHVSEKKKWGSPAIGLSLQEADLGHIEKFKSFLETDRKITISRGIGKTPQGSPSNFAQACISVTSQKIFDDLQRYGVTPRKSLTAHPLILIDNRHFWRGMVDGDGGMGLGKTEYGPMPFFSLTGSFGVASEFSRYIKTVLPKCGANPHRDRSCWSLGLSSMQAANLLKHLYEDCKISLDRKQIVVEEILKWREGRILKRAPKGCSVEGCSNIHFCKGYCNKHHHEKLYKRKTGRFNRNWSWLTKEYLLELRDGAKNWKEVAGMLDIGLALFWRIRQRLGIK